MESPPPQYQKGRNDQLKWGKLLNLIEYIGYEIVFNVLLRDVAICIGGARAAETFQHLKKFNYVLKL